MKKKNETLNVNFIEKQKELIQKIKTKESIDNDLDKPSIDESIKKYFSKIRPSHGNRMIYNQKEHNLVLGFETTGSKFIDPYYVYNGDNFA